MCREFTERKSHVFHTVSMNLEDNMDSQGVTMLHKMDRGEVDTTPIESVKAAVSIFGESVFRDPINGKKLKIPTRERKLVKESELHLAQKEFPKPEEQLQHPEATVAQSRLEVERAKKVMGDLEKARMSREMPNQISELVKLRAERPQAANTHITEVDNRDLQTQLNAAREQHMVVSAELGVAKQELKRVKEELAASVEAEALALKQAKYAKLAAEIDRSKLDELAKEIASANELFDLAKLAYEEAQRETAAIIAEEQAEAQNLAATAEQTSKQLEVSRKELAAAEDLQCKASLTATTAENLVKEVNLAKVSESKSAKSASDASKILNKLMSEFKKMQKAESDARASLESVTAELKDSKENLARATEEGFSLRGSMGFLKVELDQARKELDEVKESEARMQVSVAILNSELHQSRSKLAAAAAADAKARGVNSGLSIALKQLAIEAEAAKRVAGAMTEEARKSKLEAEQAKANTNTDTVLQDAEKTKPCAGITISQEEYGCLVKRAEEADKLAGIKVAAALAHAKECERELLMQLQVGNTEIEELKSAAQQALHKADMAETVKRAVEDELRKWRNREQRKRAEAFAAAQELQGKGNNDVSRPFAQQKPLHYEPLGKILNLRMSSAHNLDGSETVDMSAKKKKHPIPHVGGIFIKKKNQVDDISNSNSNSPYG